MSSAPIEISVKHSTNKGRQKDRQSKKVTAKTATPIAPLENPASVSNERHDSSTARDEKDPVVEEYAVFIQPMVRDGKRMFLMKLPDRTSSDLLTAAKGSLPSEVRFKPKVGILEMDIPVKPMHKNYDREKGVEWGEALKKNSQIKAAVKAGTTGLSGGFGITSSELRPKKKSAEDDGEEVPAVFEEEVAKDFDSLVLEGRVMNKQTYGGQFDSKGSYKPVYMAGVFTKAKSPGQKKQLHLTPINETVTLTPLYNHIDAQSEAERLAKPREPSTKPQETRAIHMTVKSNIEGEEDFYDTMTDRVREIAEEQWTRIKYHDEQSQESMQARHSLLINSENILESSMSAEEYMDIAVGPGRRLIPPNLKSTVKAKSK